MTSEKRLCVGANSQCLLELSLPPSLSLHLTSFSAFDLLVPLFLFLIPLLPPSSFLYSQLLSFLPLCCSPSPPFKLDYERHEHTVHTHTHTRSWDYVLKRLSVHTDDILPFDDSNFSSCSLELLKTIQTWMDTKWSVEKIIIIYVCALVRVPFIYVWPSLLVVIQMSQE